MQLVYRCPKCEQSVVEHGVEAGKTLRCPHCDWSRPLEESWHSDQSPNACLACGCNDLWRQKDFPAKLGLMLVGAGAILSTIAWKMYRPLWAIGILMAFALVDLVLFAIMPDVLVCYRCGTRHRHPPTDETVPRFDLEVAERYRQEAKRLNEATK